MYPFNLMSSYTSVDRDSPGILGSFIPLLPASMSKCPHSPILSGAPTRFILYRSMFFMSVYIVPFIPIGFLLSVRASSIISPSSALLRGVMVPFILCISACILPEILRSPSPYSLRLGIPNLRRSPLFRFMSATSASTL